MFTFQKTMFICQLLLGCSIMTSFIGAYFTNCSLRFNEVSLKITRSIQRVESLRNMPGITDVRKQLARIILLTKGFSFITAFKINPSAKTGSFASVKKIFSGIRAKEFICTDERKKQQNVLATFCNSPVKHTDELNMQKKGLYLLLGFWNLIGIFSVVNSIFSHYYTSQNEYAEVK